VIYKLCFYVPPEFAEKVKEAVFAAGAGKIGNYDYCCWQTLGEGQFRPLPEAKPAVGELYKLNIVQELKVEFVCEPSLVKTVVEALIKAHPYEEPAYHVWAVQTLEDLH
jgi:hypothetical protein